MGMFVVATTMIGSGVFLLPATLATVGTISLLGWLIAATGALLIGLSLAYLSAVSPDGFLDAIGRALGPVAGQVATLLYVLSYPLVLAAIALAAGGNIGFLVPALAQPPSSTLVAMGLVILLAILTLFGARQVARFGSFTLLVGLAPILLVATAGWTRFSAETFRAGWNMTGGSDSSALFQATLLCFWAFLGLEASSVISRQMRDPERTVPISTIGGILIASLIYISATTAISGMLPAAVLAKSTAPFADATRAFLGPAAAVVVALAAAAKALGTLGCSQLGGTEAWLCFQRQLGIAGVSFRTATLALALLAALIVWATSSPSLAGQYGQLISAVVVLTLLVFALAGAALVRVRTDAARYVGAASIIFSLGLIAAQPLQTLLLAVGTFAVVAVPLLLFRLMRRPASI
jgi:arginine:agmatine antiporter